MVVIKLKKIKKGNITTTHKHSQSQFGHMTSQTRPTEIRSARGQFQIAYNHHLQCAIGRETEMSETAISHRTAPVASVYPGLNGRPAVGVAICQQW